MSRLQDFRSSRNEQREIHRRLADDHFELI